MNTLPASMLNLLDFAGSRVKGMHGNELVDPLPSRIASLVHAHFDALPRRSKPVVRDDGSRDWTPMSAIVVVRGKN